MQEKLVSPSLDSIKVGPCSEKLPHAYLKLGFDGGVWGGGGFLRDRKVTVFLTLRVCLLGHIQEYCWNEGVPLLARCHRMRRAELWKLFQRSQAPWVAWVNNRVMMEAKLLKKTDATSSRFNCRSLLTLCT